MAFSLSLLAQIQAHTGKPEARHTAQQALDMLNRTLGPDHPRTLHAEPVLTWIANGSPALKTI